MKFEVWRIRGILILDIRCPNNSSSHVFGTCKWKEEHETWGVLSFHLIYENIYVFLLIIGPLLFPFFPSWFTGNLFFISDIVKWRHTDQEYVLPLAHHSSLDLVFSGKIWCRDSPCNGCQSPEQFLRGSKHSWNDYIVPDLKVEKEIEAAKWGRSIRLMFKQ